ncbi:MAG: glycosyltransferase family 39 protein [Chloroflexi bacterium]|nr:glycosyltransferase family 39 protein [Chloroflexota bacterium]
MSRHSILVALILIAGFAFRFGDITEVPGGFSQEEITGIRIIETIREGTIYLFFDVGDERGVESIYYALSVTITRFVGDGLVGYRALSIWLGILTLTLLFKVTQRLFGTPKAYVATIAMTISLWHSLLSRTVTHHVLLPCLVLLVMWAVTQAYHLRRRIYYFHPTTAAYTLLGVSVALTAYAHPTGFLAGIAVFLFGVQLGRRVNGALAREVWWNSGYALLMALILGIPYVISVLRNWTISGPYIFVAERPSSVVAFLESIRSTVLAFFLEGDHNPAHNVPGLPVIQLIEPVLLVVGIWIVIRRRHLPNYFLLLAFAGVSLVPDMWLDGGPDYTMLVFALPATYMLIGNGAVEIVNLVTDADNYPLRLVGLRGRVPFAGRLAVAVIIAGFIILTVRNANFIFNDWAERDDTSFSYNANLGRVARYLDSLDNDAESILVCNTRFDETPVSRFGEAVSDAQIIEWMLHRENLQYRISDCRTDLVLINGSQESMQILFTDTLDLNVVAAPMLRWFRLAEPQDDIVSEDGISVRWELDAPSQISDRVASARVVETVYYPRDLAGNLESVQLPVDFEGNLSFLGYEPLPADVVYVPGDVLALTTYWLVDDLIEDDVGVFIRLHDIPQASPYTEINSFAVDNSRLQPGDIVVQVGFLTLPPSLRPSEYLLTLGVYEGLPVNQQQVYDEVIPRGTYILIDNPFQVVHSAER